MDIHPIIIHFPIALLATYSFLTILPLKRYWPNTPWNTFTDILLILGILGAIPALLSGDAASERRGEDALVETHALFAYLAVYTYGICALPTIQRLFAYIKKGATKGVMGQFYMLLISINRIITNQYLQIALPVLGFLFLLITGALGGVMVYGTSADPLAPFILQMLGIKY